MTITELTEELQKHPGSIEDRNTLSTTEVASAFQNTGAVLIKLEQPVKAAA